MQFNAVDIRDTLATIPCRYCGGVGGNATLETEGLHFARIECLSCSAWLDWLGWPPNPEKKRRGRRSLVTRLGDDRCEICHRSRFEIPPPGQLEAHHVIQKTAGGADDPQNLRLYCSPCHELVHWARTYFGHYHPDENAA